MFHTLKFTDDVLVDLDNPGTDRLERILIRQGTRVQARLTPFVVETEDGPLEAADLLLRDGTVINGMPYAWFSFMD